MTGHVPAGVLRGADSLFFGHDESAGCDDISPERQLWASVIHQAWLDAFVLSDAAITMKGEATGGGRRLRDQARRWLVWNFGDLREDRETVCELAGVDPDMLRQLAVRKLAEVKAAESKAAQTIQEATKPKRRKDEPAPSLSIDQLFERLLKRAPYLTARNLDRELAELAKRESSLAPAA